MSKKDKGVHVIVSSNYYRMMHKTRMKLNRKRPISLIKLTDMMALGPPLYKDKAWIRKVKKWGI